MKFSVILPIYKVEKYLSACVDSILNQSYTDFEVILVDDGSPDRCPKICDEYATKDKRVKVIHQSNAGNSRARNAGLECARGSYIIYIDSDDYLVGDTVLEKISEKTLSDPDVILYGYKKYFESDETYGAPVCNFPEMLKNETVASYLNKLLITGTYSGTAWCKVIKTSLLKDNNIKFKPGLISEDHDWYIQVMMRVKSYAAINEALYVYRLRPDSISHAGGNVKSLTDNLWIQETWWKRIDSADISEDLRLSLRQVWAKYMGDVMVQYSGFEKHIRKQYRSQIKGLMPLFDYAVTRRSLIIKRCCNIFGVSITSFLLRAVRKIKKTT